MIDDLHWILLHKMVKSVLLEDSLLLALKKWIIMSWAPTLGVGGDKKLNVASAWQ